jgi:hypothetical protein
LRLRDERDERSGQERVGSCPSPEAAPRAARRSILAQQGSRAAGAPPESPPQGPGERRRMGLLVELDVRNGLLWLVVVGLAAVVVCCSSACSPRQGALRPRQPPPDAGPVPNPAGRWRRRHLVGQRPGAPPRHECPRERGSGLGLSIEGASAGWRAECSQLARGPWGEVRTPARRQSTPPLPCANAAFRFGGGLGGEKGPSLAPFPFGLAGSHANGAGLALAELVMWRGLGNGYSHWRSPRRAACCCAWSGRSSDHCCCLSASQRPRRRPGDHPARFHSRPRCTRFRSPPRPPSPWPQNLKQIRYMR